MKLKEIKRSLRAWKYSHATKRVKEARKEAFQKEWLNPANWINEPRPCYTDQPH